MELSQGRWCVIVTSDISVLFVRLVHPLLTYYLPILLFPRTSYKGSHNLLHEQDTARTTLNIKQFFPKIQKAPFQHQKQPQKTRESKMLDPKANPNGSEHLVDKLRPTNLLTSVFRTPGVKNVEKAFSRGGTPPTRQAAVGTRTDSADQVGAKNVGTVSPLHFLSSYLPSRSGLGSLFEVDMHRGIVPRRPWPDRQIFLDIEPTVWNAMLTLVMHLQQADNSESFQTNISDQRPEVSLTSTRTVLDDGR